MPPGFKLKRRKTLPILRVTQDIAYGGYSKHAVSPRGVIPEMPTALSGIVANAGARYDPGYGASAVPR
jgi:hypothetical protein